MASAPPNQQQPGFFDRWMKVITAVLAALSTCLTIWNVWLTGNINRLNQQLSQTTAEREWSSKIFDKYSTAVTAKELSPDQRVAALAPLANLVILVSNDKVRDGLGKSIADQVVVYQGQLEKKSEDQDGVAQAQTEIVIRQAAAVAEQAEKAITSEAKPNITTAAAPARTAAAGGSGTRYNFDIFWCEGWSPAQGLAGRIASLKARMPGTMGNWRVRMLSSTVNARPGYGKKGLLINYSSSDELPLAQALQRQIEGDGRLAEELPPVRILPVSMKTPGYLSVFVCPT